MKTGQYYFRSKPARDAIKFTLNIESLLKHTDSGVLVDHFSKMGQTEAEIKEDKKVAD